MHRELRLSFVFVADWELNRKRVLLEDEIRYN